MTIPIRLREPKVEMKHKPHIMDVPVWTVEDVLSWVRRNGFSAFAEAFRDSEVDGDLLLQLDEVNLKNDIGIENGILRKRFSRELNNLKKNADYSCVDRLGITSFLTNLDLKCYTYNLILNDMSPDYMKRLNANDLDDMLKVDAGITSAVHRHQIIEACREPIANTVIDVDTLDQDTFYDVYITHAGLSHGSVELASLLTIQLHYRELNIFNPSEHSELTQMCGADFCNPEANAQALMKCKNVVIVLGPGDLDGCIGDYHCKDKLHKILKVALNKKDCNIILVTDEDFQFPDLEDLPEDMRGLYCHMKQVKWCHDYQDACIDKLERLLRGEAFLRSTLNLNGGWRTPNFAPTLSTQTSRSRSDSGRSSPTRLTPIKILRTRQDSVDSAISP